MTHTFSGTPPNHRDAIAYAHTPPHTAVRLLPRVVHQSADMDRLVRMYTYTKTLPPSPPTYVLP